MDWTAVLEFDDTVKMTAEWYQNYLKSKNNIYEVTKDQIIKYTNYAKVKKSILVKKLTFYEMYYA